MSERLGEEVQVSDSGEEVQVKPVEPCGNEDCDKCNPIPRFIVSTERVARLKHSRDIKAVTPEEARRIYDEGTAWPSSYDDRELAVLEQGDTVVELAEPREAWLVERLCYHRLPAQPPGEPALDASDEFDAPDDPLEEARSLLRRWRDLPIEAPGDLVEATDRFLAGGQPS